MTTRVSSIKFVGIWNSAIERAALAAEGHSSAMNGKAMKHFQDPLIAGFVVARDFDIAVAIRALKKPGQTQ